MVEKAGICSPFISSTKFVNCCMSGEKSKNLGLPSAKDEFRKELLKVLRKPYDKEEHRKARETIGAGSYTKHLRAKVLSLLSVLNWQFSSAILICYYRGSLIM